MDNGCIDVSPGKSVIRASICVCEAPLLNNQSLHHARVHEIRTNVIIILTTLLANKWARFSILFIARIPASDETIMVAPTWLPGNHLDAARVVN